MPNSYTRIFIHATFAVQAHASLIREKVESQIHDAIQEQLERLGCPVIAIGGMPDHVHVLFRQNEQKSLPDIMQQVKGFTSHHINAADLIPEKFAWQKGYGGYSVSEDQLEKVKGFIRSQKQIHKKRTYFQELEAVVSDRQFGHMRMD